MGLFDIFKREKKVETCSCGGESCGGPRREDGDASVKILGSGCAKCNELEKETIEALRELGMDTDVDHVTDFAEIGKYGVMSTPALVLDGRVLSSGKVLKKDQVIELIQKARG